MDDGILHYFEANIEFALPSNERVINPLLVVGYVNDIDVYHMDDGISHHFEANIEFALPSNKHVIDSLLVARYVNEANMYEDDESDVFSVVKNVEDYVFEGDDLNKGDMSEGGEPSNYPENDSGNSENEPEDSPLKKIYTEQMFTSFEVLEQCLKWYSNRISFETKIVRIEKENDVCFKKTYKCRHGGKYSPKKKLDPTTNKNQEHYEELQILLNTALGDCDEIGLALFDKNQGSSVLLIRNEDESFLTSTFQALKRIRRPEINIRNVMELDSKKQVSAQNKNLSEQELIQENDNLSISNPHQYKGKDYPANKRYLSAIENHNSMNIVLSNQNEILASRSKKKNK
ncbi:11416_t:CDS:2, partial [Racocetra fulgida]